MKKNVIAFALLIGLSTAAFAQDLTAVKSGKATKTYGKLLWGLYKWGEQPDEVGSSDFHNVATDTTLYQMKSFLENGNEFYNVTIDTTQYEIKSILGGAIQWSVRKKKGTEKEVSTSN